jgi:tetrahydromethanopterin S-methyltransferase subunit G
VQESEEAKALFEGMTDEEKKSVGALQRKLAELDATHAKLATQVTGLAHQKSDLEKEVETYKITARNQQNEIKKLQNRANALEVKVEMKDYLVQEANSEKKLLIREKEKLIQDILELKKLNSVHEQLEKCENKIQFANNTR